MAQIDLSPIKTAVFTLAAVLTATVVTASAGEKTDIATLSIPTVDISGERDRHTVINAGTEDVYHGHADTVLLPDEKTMFCVWTLNHGWGEPLLKRSGDAGKTWVDVPIPETWNTAWCKYTSGPESTLGGKSRGWLPMVHYLVGPDGKGRLFIWDRGKDDRMIQSVSEDGGQTWSPMQENGLAGCIEPSMNVIASDDGKKQLMWYTDWNPSVNQAVSRNGGLTWEGQLDVIDTTDFPGVKMIEPGVIRSPDGRQLLMLIRDFAKGGKYNSLYAVSDDEGATWSKPKRLPAPLTGDRHSPIYAPDGRLVVLMRDKLSSRDQSPTTGHFIAWVGRYEDILAGKPGQYRVKLLHSHAGGDCAYPSIHLLPNGDFFATTYIKYESGPRHQSTVTTRFNLRELDRRIEINDASIMAPLELRSNDDGVQLQNGPAAQMEWEVGEVDTFTEGAILFSDRKYQLAEVPPVLSGKPFVRSAIGRTRGTCARAGVLWVVTPSPGRNPGSRVHQTLIDAGFKCAAVPEFQLFGTRSTEWCSVYQKTLEKGETFDIGIYGVVVVPDREADGLPVVDALTPVLLNTTPGPEYQAAARLYQGIPGIARDEASGRLWATWYSGGKGECSDNYVLVVTSGDDGATWTEPVLVIDPPSKVRAFDECLWMAPDGRLFLFYAQADASANLHDGRWGVWYTICHQPGRADSPWTPPVRICDGITLNQPTVLSDGSWLLPVAMWGDKMQGAGIVRSRDSGKTYEWIGGAGGGGLEHMIVERKDGSLWMLMRRGEGMAESTSQDGGVTWSKTTPTLIDGPGSRFHIRRLRSGRLLLVNHVGFVREGNRFLDWRSHMTALLSDDDGQTWPYRLLLDERKDVSYPDAIESKDGRLYIIYDRGRYSEREILMAVTSESDILAGKAGPETRLRVLVNKATGDRSKH